MLKQLVNVDNDLENTQPVNGFTKRQFKSPTIVFFFLSKCSIYCGISNYSILEMYFFLLHLV